MSYFSNAANALLQKLVENDFRNCVETYKKICLHSEQASVLFPGLVACLGLALNYYEPFPVISAHIQGQRLSIIVKMDKRALRPSEAIWKLALVSFVATSASANLSYIINKSLWA